MASRRAVDRLVRTLGKGLLWSCAVVGVLMGAVGAFSASSFGRPRVAGFLVEQIDAALAGRLALAEARVLPNGGIELRGLEVYDPEGHLVLQVSAARLYADLTRLRSRVVGVVLELDAPSVLLESEPGGGISLLRAFAPATPSPPRPDQRQGLARPAWTLRLTRLTLRGGDVWWQDERGITSLEATAVDLDAEASYGPRGGFLELTTTGELSAPVVGASSLAVAAHLEGDRLTVPALSASLGGTRLEGLGEADLARRTFRAAVTRFGLTPDGLAALAPAGSPAAAGGRLGSALTGRLYAESDGAKATAALDVGADGTPAAAGPAAGADAEGGGGRASAAVAVALPPAAPAAGLDLVVDRLDPSRLLAQAPPGRVTLTARGAAAGATLAAARGRVDLALAPSRLRGGEVGPATLRAAIDRGLVTVERLDARVPGLTATGSGRWRAQGAVGGAFTLDAADLGVAGRNLTALGVPGLPPLGGRLHAEAALSGTAAAPAVRATVDAPRLEVGALRADGARLQVEGAGPLAAGRGRVTGAVARLTAGGVDLRAIALEAGLAGDEASLTLSGLAPKLGTDPVSLTAGALLAKDRGSATLRELTLGWPETRYALAAPAQVTLPAGPRTGLRVERVELADGPRRLTLEGGLGDRGDLDARVEARRLDLARLPRGLVAADLGVAGLLDLTLRVTGPTARPKVEAHLAVEGGAVGGAAGLSGLTLAGDAAWDGGEERLTADLRLGRAQGGTLSVVAALDFPLPAHGARGEAAESLVVTAAGWPIPALRDALDPAADLPVTGTVGGRLALGGTAGAPTLSLRATGDALTWRDLGPFDAVVTVEDPGEAAHLAAETTHAGGKLLTATADLPVDVAALLARPGPTARALAEAPVTVAVDVAGADLAPFAGKSGLPEDLAGTVTGTAALHGTLRAPRGTVALALRDGAATGYRDLGGALEATLEAARTALTGRLTLGQEEALRFTGSLALAPERLAEPKALRAAPLALDATVPPVSLERATAAAALVTGRVAAHLVAGGTLAAPTAALDLDAAGVAVEGRPLGDLTATAHAAGGANTAELAFRAAAGGTLRAAGGLDAPLGLDTTPASLARAPARLRVTSEALDLGFLPALLPTFVRAASGRLDVEATAAGPLEAMVPKGTVALTGGRLAISEYGEWQELALELRLEDQALEVPKLAARRGSGRFDGTLSVRGLGSPSATIAGTLAMKQLTVSRAGQDLATFDLGGTLAGTATPTLLDTTLTVSPGTIRLPKKLPRTLQTLERRTDIVVGRPRRTRPRPAAGPQAEARQARLRVLIPGRVFVKSESPRVDAELKGDTTWHLEGSELVAEGTMEVVRGTFEPIDGRVFVLERGRVQFTAAGYQTAQLDVVARYENPAATVTATVGGWLSKPDVALTSRPPLDDAAIAMLIATGRTELKTGTSEVGSLTGKDAGISVLGAVVMGAFREVVADKLPVDSISVASDSFRTGKYLTDKLFVAYTRRFEARPEKGENPDEVRVEYQLTPRWQFESRYGNAQSGGASLIWSRDY